MNTNIVFLTIASLVGILSAVEGIRMLPVFLLYIIFLIYLKKSSSNWLIIYFGFYLLFFIMSQYTISHNKTLLDPKQNVFQIRFSDEVKINGDLLRAIVRESSSKEKLVLFYRISSEEEKQRLLEHSLIGLSCRVVGSLEIPESARNENAFNYRKYLYQNKIHWQLKTSEWDMSNCSIMQTSILDQLKGWRQLGISLIEKNFSKEAGPIAAALLFGSRDLLEEDMVKAYQKLGVIHLISISGLHVALLVGMMFYLGIRIGLVREKLTWGLVFILPLYAIISGASPPVNRAVLMAVFILVASLFRFPIRLRTTDGLCLSFLLITIINPLIIYNIGFQLSYIVTFALLLSKDIIARYPSYLWQMVIISLISQTSALPFLLYHFFEIPLISMVANTLYIPLYSFIFMPGLILLYLVQFISNDLFQLLSICLSWMINISNELAVWSTSFKWTRIVPGRPSTLFLTMYFMAIALSFYYWEMRRYVLIVLALPWVIIGIQLISPNFSSKGEVSIIDVGQGDSILIQLPYNKGNYLIDTGGNISFPSEAWKKEKQKFEVGEDILVPYLKAIGITKLDLLILTHGDMDHIGGSLALLREMEVEEIFLPSLEAPKTTAEKEIINLAQHQKSRITYVYEGLSWRVSDSHFEILAPHPQFSGEKNEGSIVLHAQIGGLNWLFTGDLGIEGEKLLLTSYPHMKINVLKVGHHGSKTSTSDEFIQTFTPEYAIISAGKQNRFGHPHPDVLKTLQLYKSNIMRTDLNGEISYKFSTKMRTFVSELP
jgi:competence protein ComEC